MEFEEFAARAGALLDAVVGDDESVVIVRGSAPVAVLSSIAANHSQALLADLPRWEEWVHEVRESFAEAGGRSLQPQVLPPDPPEVDKTLLGFDPAAGLVGSDSGREVLAAELARLNVPVRDEALLADIYAAVLPKP